MNTPVYVSGAVEGSTDEAVFRRLVRHVRAETHRVQVQHGKSSLRTGASGLQRGSEVGVPRCARGPRPGIRLPRCSSV